jgi:hypothetical protein
MDNNPTGLSQYFAGLNNPYAYPPRNNPDTFDMFSQEFVVVNKKRGLVIHTDLTYQDNRVAKIRRGNLFKHSRMFSHGFNF